MKNIYFYEKIDMYQIELFEQIPQTISSVLVTFNLVYTFLKTGIAEEGLTSILPKMFASAVTQRHRDRRPSKGAPATKFWNASSVSKQGGLMLFAEHFTNCL